MKPLDPDAPPVRAYTVPQTAKMLRLSTNTVRRMINEGELRAVRLRGSIRVPVESIDEAMGCA